MLDCSVLTPLAADYFAKLDRLNRKFSSIQRFGNLLAQASDPNTFLPNIDEMVPPIGLDLSSYNRLRAACPMMGLPDVGNDLAKAQDLLRAAYADLLAQLNNHPFGSLEGLQNKMDKFFSNLQIDLSHIDAYVQCAQAACSAVSNLPSSIRNNQRIVAEYCSGFGANEGVVLSTRATDASNSFKTMNQKLTVLTQ